MKIPRIMIAAPTSGCGKTTIACGLMYALKSRGYRIAAAKCGPDYIDPMFHREVLGMDSQNLDLFFCGQEDLKELFAGHAAGADMAVIEGVMGYYDGMALDSDRASSYETAKALDVPVLLAVNGKGAALSVLALLKGFLTFREDHHIAGVILNRTSKAVYPRMKEMIERGLRDMGYPIPVVGFVPENPIFHVKSRHLGLVTPEEIGDLKAVFKEIGKTFEETMDLKQIIRIADAAKPLKIPASLENLLKISTSLQKLAEISTSLAGPPEIPASSGGPPKLRLAVARDPAFCFYYKDNLRLLERLGCELAPFSPLADEHLPEGISGLLLGGGYPEVYAGKLSENVRLRQEIRDVLEEGLPCHAECGGFMYLHEAMEGADGRVCEMAGFIEGEALRRDRLVRFGYIQIEGAGNSAYLHRGEILRGHEFHYWDSSDNGDGCIARKPGRDVSWKCIHTRKNVFAGFPHIYYYSNIQFARRFVERMKEYRGYEYRRDL